MEKDPLFFHSSGSQNILTQCLIVAWLIIICWREGEMKGGRRERVEGKEGGKERRRDGKGKQRGKEGGMEAGRRIAKWTSAFSHIGRQFIR